MLATRLATGNDFFTSALVRVHDTVGTLPTTLDCAPALSLLQQATVQQALEALRHLSPEDHTIYYLFVTDISERLVGVVSIHTLLTARQGAHLFEIMERDYVAVPQHARPHEQAHLMIEAGSTAMPVVDDEGHLVGAIDSTDVLRSLQPTAPWQTRQASHSFANRPFAALLTRNGWLVGAAVLGLVIAFLSLTVLHAGGLPTLMLSLLPLLLLVSTQTARQTHAVARCAPPIRATPLHRELGQLLMAGLVVGTLTGGALLLWQANIMLAVIIGGAVLVTVIVVALAVWLVTATTLRYRHSTATDTTGVALALAVLGSLTIWLTLTATLTAHGLLS